MAESLLFRNEMWVCWCLNRDSNLLMIKCAALIKMTVKYCMIV